MPQVNGVCLCVNVWFLYEAVSPGDEKVKYVNNKVLICHVADATDVIFCSFGVGFCFSSNS